MNRENTQRLTDLRTYLDRGLTLVPIAPAPDGSPRKGPTAPGWNDAANVIARADDPRLEPIAEGKHNVGLLHEPSHTLARQSRGAGSAAANRVELLQADQNLPALGAVRRPQDTRVEQLIDDPGRAPVPDAESALKQRCRPTAVLDTQLGGRPEELVPILGAPPSRCRPAYAGRLRAGTRHAAARPVDRERR